MENEATPIKGNPFTDRQSSTRIRSSAAEKS